jgi:hypothetical protein
MVADERRQKAQIEEELQNARQEREALKGALRIVEGENAVLRSGSGHSKKPSLEGSTLSFRERPRALTIDTEKAGSQGDGVPNRVIDLSQTPSTSELRSTAQGQTSTSTIEDASDASVISEINDHKRGVSSTSQMGITHRSSASNERATHSRRNTGSSIKSLKKPDSEQVNPVMRGGITFGI